MKLSTFALKSGRRRPASPASTTPEQLLDFIRRDDARWAKLIKERDIAVEGAK